MALSRIKCANALTFSSTESMRPKTACVNSTADSFFDCRSSRACIMVMRYIKLDYFISILNEKLTSFSHICDYAIDDLVAFYERDPACHWFYQPFLFYKGFIALQAHRIGNVLYNNGDIDLSLYLQMRISEIFSIDIHPGATIGKGIMLDHAHNLVIGETAEIGDNVSVLHSVTLGGTGKVRGNRHPKIGNNVLIGAGAKILGNISVGECSRVAAGSLVLKSVPPFKTVAGVPAKEVGSSGCPEPSKMMDQLLNKNWST